MIATCIKYPCSMSAALWAMRCSNIVDGLLWRGTLVWVTCYSDSRRLLTLKTFYGCWNSWLYTWRQFSRDVSGSRTLVITWPGIYDSRPRDRISDQVIWPTVTWPPLYGTSSCNWSALLIGLQSLTGLSWPNFKWKISHYTVWWENKENASRNQHNGWGCMTRGQATLPFSVMKRSLSKL